MTDRFPIGVMIKADNDFVGKVTGHSPRNGERWLWVMADNGGELLVPESAVVSVCSDPLKGWKPAEKPDPPLARLGPGGDYTQDYEPETCIAEDDATAAQLLFEASAVATIFCVAAFAGGLVGGVVGVWWLAG